LIKLVIDIGNTAVKCAVFEQAEMRGMLVVPQLSATSLAELIVQYGEPTCAIIANVRNETEFQSHFEIVQQRVGKVLMMDAATKTPLRNLYQTPQTLGCDRLAAAVGANVLYPHRNVLVVSIGTALTYELVNEQDEYVGGNISLGLRTRYAALHHFTGKLPLCQPVAQAPAIGKNTCGAITAEFQNGMLYEIQGVIRQFSFQYPRLQTVLTGGDAALFAPHLQGVPTVPHLTLTGLNRIADQ
jgi:type III pantothenate kinase